MYSIYPCLPLIAKSSEADNHPCSEVYVAKSVSVLITDSRVEVNDLSTSLSLYEDSSLLVPMLTKKIAEDRYLRLWDAPPVYIRDETLPEGYGFYLAGEDGISNTGGRDPDDVNSWDISSYHFYTHRVRRQEALRNTYISIIPTL